MIRSIDRAGLVLQRISSDPLLEKQVEEAAQQIANMSKATKVIVSGMGKAGLIGRKFSATLSSVGIPSFFVHPGEAAHGDLGSISTNDIVFVLSTSGRTEEVHAFLEQLAALSSPIVIGISSFPKRFPKYVQRVDMGEIDEADLFGLVPTTSTLVMLAICDEIALRAATYTGFTAETFAMRHHGGYLGKKARGEE